MSKSKSMAQQELEKRVADTDEKRVLLVCYAMDLREGRQPSAKAVRGRFTAEVFRADKPSGGYIIITEGGVQGFSIQSFMDWRSWVRENHFPLDDLTLKQLAFDLDTEVAAKDSAQTHENTL